ncbi:MAG: MFS transporter, partial [Thermomicrobium sp.]|nr:MFS transporter [Thermomicrobium sp.]
MRQRHFTAARSRMMTSHGFLLGILTVCFFVGFSSVAALSPLVASLGQVYNLSRLERGIAVAAPALTGALLRIPAAYRADREGGRRTVVCLLGISALGFALLATIAALVGTIHLPRPMLLSLLVGAGAAAGAGAALFAPGATYLTYIVPFGMLGRATGLFGGLGNLGAGIAALVLPFAVLRFGLPACYACWAFVLA